MCGIIGIIYKNIIPQLIIGLKQLQNRGYDSAGISYFDTNDNIVTYKYASTHENAIDKLIKHQYDDNEITCGIAHTRWATHGGKTNENSHPHSSFDNKFYLVHNGIIENYFEIKQELLRKNKNILFKSETDSEVISCLLAYIYDQQEIKDISLAIKETCKKLQGTWALVIMCIDKPDHLYCTRHGSPILIGKSENSVYVVSEKSAFSNKIKDYIVLSNNDICHLYFQNSKLNIETSEIYEPKELKYNISELSCKPYDHFMQKEIMEQVDSSLRAMSLGGRILYNDQVKLGGLESYSFQLLNIDNLILLGCGTSYYAGLLGIEYFKELSNFDHVSIFDGAEFNVKDIPKKGNTGIVLLSQSGETKDLHRCIEIGKNHDLFMIGVINVVDSLIAREVDCGVYLNAGREVGVASTKSFTSQIIILSLMAIWFAQKRGINLNIRRKYINDLRNLHMNIEKILEKCLNKMNDFLELFEKFSSCFILGKGRSYPIALEGSLKIKEVSYIHAEGYNASSLKHGPLALLEEGFPVILINSNFYDSSKIHNCYREIKSRGSNVLYLTIENEKDVNFLDENDKVFSINLNTTNTFSELLTIIPIQFLAYYIALSKNLNPDMPRNLAKVVTVE